MDQRESGQDIKYNICFLQYSLQGGGAERKVCTLANFFAQRGHSVEIGLFGRNIVAYRLSDEVKLTYIDRSSYQYKGKKDKIGYIFRKAMAKAFVGFPVYMLEKAAGIVHKRLPAHISSDRVIAHYRKKYNYLQPIQSFFKRRPDTIFITMTVQAYNEIMRIMEGDYRSGKVKNPYIVMECNNPTPGLDSSPADDELRRKYYPMASRCAMMTQGAKNYFSEEIQKKCIVIPNPLRDDLPEPYSGVRRKVIVNYCRLERQKNLLLLIDAFAIFHQDHSDYSLELYGQGKMKDELNRRISDLNLNDCASIHPFDPNILQKIRDCAMFVSTSDWEGFPNSILEALALGIPTISTDCDFGPRDMICDHNNGILVPVGDTAALVSAMTEIANTPKIADNMSKRSIKIRETHSISVIGKRWLDMMSEIAQERSFSDMKNNKRR